MINKYLPSGSFLLISLLAFGLAGCNLPEPEAVSAPTLSVTQAYQTVEARLTQAFTQTSQAVVTPRATDSGIPAGTDTPTPTIASTSPTVDPPVTSPTPTEICDRAAAGNPIDITIPDDSEMAPGETFTKVWRLQNAGSCTWTRQYTAELFSGEGMGAPQQVFLPSEVQPGDSVEISIDLIAPQSPGLHQGNWKLRNAADQWFGIGPNGTAPFWVRIVVKALPTASPTPSTPTPTLTPTPAVLANGAVALVPNYTLDWDSAQTNSAEGEDILYRLDPNGTLWLELRSGARFSLFTSGQPSISDCRSAELGNAPVQLQGAMTGSYFCYRTSLGLPGRMQIVSLDEETYLLNVDILTWSLP